MSQGIQDKIVARQVKKHIPLNSRKQTRVMIIKQHVPETVARMGHHMESVTLILGSVLATLIGYAKTALRRNVQMTAWGMANAILQMDYASARKDLQV